ncbi:FISUMP domain-containing protein [Dysgonomonas sp. ZJ709]|uniref:FISUMP domain-containing protein n=1 Tax=Dysgonomonas sp. ZJ709 TaxID=2709797 RepID=UPI0013ECD6DB|nr:FISUMP domain-containing protein [Dysgonomonas sp. ZJ709]
MILKHIRNIFLPVAIFALGVSCLNAQITIGSTLPPNTGALLDLKEFAPNAQNATSTKGLQLPRVFLTSPTSLMDVLKGESEIVDPLLATGLWIYNVNETSAICPGVYLWDGSRWNSMMHTVLESFDDIRTKADGSIEHIVYPARTFGTAGTWMLENLRATTYADNLGVNKATNDIQVTKPTTSLTLKAAYYPNADKALFDQNPGYGMLYTFAGATNGKTKTINEGESGATSGTPNPIPGNVEQVGAQGICPDGWHLPSDKEWNDLEEVIANEQTGLYTIDNYKSNPWNSDGQDWRLLKMVNRNSVIGHGASMKTAFVKVNNDAVTGKSASYCNGGFNILVIGVVNNAGIGVSYGSIAIFWSNSANGDSGNAIVRTLSRTSSGVTRTSGSRDFGYSVRCKKN